MFVILQAFLTTVSAAIAVADPTPITIGCAVFCASVLLWSIVEAGAR